MSSPAPRTSQRRRRNTGAERRLLECRALEQFGEVLIWEISPTCLTRTVSARVIGSWRLSAASRDRPDSQRRVRSPVDHSLRVYSWGALRGALRDLRWEAISRRSPDGFADKPDTTFGTINADVLAEKLPGYVRPNFCAIIRGSKHST
jgi:hypothetical protein